MDISPGSPMGAMGRRGYGGPGGPSSGLHRDLDHHDALAPHFLPVNMSMSPGDFLPAEAQPGMDHDATGVASGQTPGYSLPEQVGNGGTGEGSGLQGHVAAAPGLGSDPGREEVQLEVEPTAPLAFAVALPPSVYRQDIAMPGGHGALPGGARTTAGGGRSAHHQDATSTGGAHDAAQYLSDGGRLAEGKRWEKRGWSWGPAPSMAPQVYRSQAGTGFAFRVKPPRRSCTLGRFSF
jgi:hypothetical protein